MEKIPKEIYTKELREEAVKLVAEGGLTIPEVGRKVIDCRFNTAVLGSGEQ